jgi:hypothetical protein
MVILFNEEDLISFGTFIKSEKRSEMYKALVEEYPQLDPDQVTTADLSLWAETQESR